tara:strand:+ start:166 stop:336 length:171 start_codon:yes stop_codon:yes gene_type:complete
MKLSKEKFLGIALMLVALALNFSAIEFTGIGFLAGIICALGLGLFLFKFKLFKTKN